MTAKLIWATPDAEQLLAKIARVSNPANQDNPDFAGLLRYMIRNKHWSPFEMVSACVEINTTRDVARQILRHRSFSFQEFSGRYQTHDTLGAPVPREARMQDKTNRQSSLPCDDALLAKRWAAAQSEVMRAATDTYEWALRQGIAKEVARAVLPEGMTPSRLYMAGTLRSWLHYLEIRTDDATQKEHRVIARSIHDALDPVFPVTFSAFFS